ncbi:MAG: site-specific integrase [Lachnospiraceae bacterium]|nr:site-specific integrase [Lachnospiraceae bacterium]
MKSKDFDRLFFSKTREFLDSYLTSQCSRSPHTVKAYRDALTVFRRYVKSAGFSIRTFGFDDCTRDFLLGFMEYLQDCGYEKSSCNQRLAAIKSYMWYVADGDVTWQQSALMVSRVPFLRNPEKEKDILSEECLKALFLAPGVSKRGIRDATIMITLYDSAIRISELLCLKLSDVNLRKDSPYMRIKGKGDKERIVSVSDNAAGHLENYIQLYHSIEYPGTDYLFYSIIHGKPHKMSPGNVARIINKYADQIRNDCHDLPDRVHPHMFRRTRATNLYQSNVELELVSRILGHASTQTTRIYAKPSLEMLKEAMDKSNPELNVEKPLWPDDEEELAKICGLR